MARSRPRPRPGGGVLSPVGTPHLTLAISPDEPVVGDLVTITGTITGGAAAGFAAISASLGGVPLVLDGVGLARSVTVTAEGALAVLASVSVDGQLIGASASAQVDAAPGAVAPAAFGAGDWTWNGSPATGNAILGITSIPATTTEIDYTFDDGATVHTLWHATTGTRYIPGLTPGATIPCRVRARRGALASDWSAVPKTAVAGAVVNTPVTSLPLAPDSRYIARAADITEADGRVVEWRDSVGSTHLVDTSAVGSQAVTKTTDARGRDCLRLRTTLTGTTWSAAGKPMSLVNDAVVYDPREISVFIVARNLEGLSIIGDTAGAATKIQIMGSSRNIQGFDTFLVNNSSFTVLTGARALSSSQHLWHGRASRSTGQYRMGTNGAWDTFGNSLSVTTATGFGLPNDGIADIYEILVYRRALTQTEAESVANAIAAHYGFVPFDSVLVAEGDSISAWNGGGNAASNSDDVGAVPANFAALPAATPGNTILDLITQLASGQNWNNRWTAARIPNRRVVQINIGRNDYAAGIETVKTRYTDLLTGANSPLLSGWDVVIVGNVGDVTPMVNVVMAELRDWLASPAFLTAVNAGPGQTYAGRVHYRPGYLGTPDGVTFPLRDDPGGAYWYDGTHPNSEGTKLWVGGGVTPASGSAHDLP